MRRGDLVTVEAGQTTGLRRTSQVMIDKATTILRVKAGARIGHVDRATLGTVSRALAAFLEVG